MIRLTRGLISLAKDSHVDNNYEEILVYQYFGSSVRPKNGEVASTNTFYVTNSHIMTNYVHCITLAKYVCSLPCSVGCASNW